MFICRTCQCVLDVVTDTDGSTLVHPPSAPQDHEVVPVRAPADFAGGKCDFCGQGHPAFVLPANDFRIPHDSMRMSEGPWAACEACAGLIDSEKWTKLVKRVSTCIARSQGRERVDPGDLAILHNLYRALRANIKGPLRRLGQP